MLVLTHNKKNTNVFLVFFLLSCLPLLVSFLIQSQTYKGLSKTGTHAEAWVGCGQGRQPKKDGQAFTWLCAGRKRRAPVVVLAFCVRLESEQGENVHVEMRREVGERHQQ